MITTIPFRPPVPFRAIEREAAALRFPARVSACMQVRPVFFVYFVIVHPEFAYTASGKRRGFGMFISQLENLAGAYCVNAWWVTDAQADALGVDDPLLAVAIRRPTGRRY